MTDKTKELNKEIKELLCKISQYKYKISVLTYTNKDLKTRIEMLEEIIGEESGVISND